MHNELPSQTGKRPDFIAYNVQESRDRKGYWSKIGAAWRHRDGQGCDIQLDSLPVNGRVTLRQMREERMQDYETERQSTNAAPSRDQTRSYERGR